MGMNRKGVFVCAVLFLFCFPIIESASAQTLAGVVVGDTFTYDFAAYFKPDNPNATAPQLLVQDNETQWVRYTIETVANMTVLYNTMQHLSNGTETNSESQANMETGYSGFPFIRANISRNDLLFPLFPAESAPIVNETLTRTYQQGERNINHANWNDTGTLIDLFFDQKTGVPVELHVTFAVTMDGNAEYVYQLIDSNIWAIPEFPSAAVLPLLAAASFMGALLYKRNLNRHKQ